MVTRREDALQMVRSAMLLASVFPELRDQAVLLSGKLTELATVMGDIRRESDRLRTETQRLTDARLRLDNLLLEKRDSLEKRQNELQEVRTAVNDLSRSVRDMNELITKLDNTVSERSGITKYNEELAKQPEATAQSGASASPADTSGQPVAKDTASANVRLAMVNPGRMMPSIPFAKAKGRLPLPASGRRVYGFGDKTDVGATSKGVVVETRPGAQVTSPADGWVVYAGEFRSYHQLLIINAGGGYHIVLAGLNRITANVGQFVLAGEPVGTMRGQAMPTATRTKSENKAPEAAPVLYVEFRKEGRTVDPGPWWAPEGAQKVQG
jgi:septal ring factor EnvC (AmiA/AmiB activator)